MFGFLRALDPVARAVDKARRDHLPLRIDPLRVRRHGDVPGRDDAIAPPR